MTANIAEDGRPAKLTETDYLLFDEEEYAQAQKSKFRFKSAKRKSNNDDEEFYTTNRSDGHRHRGHHRSKRKRSEPPGDPSRCDDTYLPNTSSSQHLNSDSAFRESLFDAMADDEGAQFWEGVYGQPFPKISPVKEGPTGKLEKMTDEEYAAHVRAEMYKKTHQYLVEEKIRRDKAKKEKETMDAKARGDAEETDKFRRHVEESLRRGRERKDRAQRALNWSQKWKDYEMAWVELVDRNRIGEVKIPWPVLDGMRATISKDEIESFFLNASSSGQPDQADLLKVLKVERVRWHPDKIQQKLGGQRVDEATMRSVTAVFQIIDCMWNDMRHRSSRN